MNLLRRLLSRLASEHVVSAEAPHDFKPWRVQAFLLSSVTGGEEFAYASRYFMTEREARKAGDELRRSFAPGMVRVEVKEDLA